MGPEYKTCQKNVSLFPQLFVFCYETDIRLTIAKTSNNISFACTACDEAASSLGRFTFRTIFFLSLSFLSSSGHFSGSFAISNSLFGVVLIL